MLQAILAVMLGGATGTVLALSMGHFWLLGTLLGGLTGYLSYNIPEVVLAVPRVWRRVRGVRIDTTGLGRSMGWLFLGAFACTQTVSLVTHGIGISVDQQLSGQSALLMDIVLMPLSTSLILAVVLTCALFDDRVLAQKVGRDIFLRMNLVSACYWMLVGTGKLLVATASFVPTLVRTVYSELRLVVGLSALQGSVCGWYAHNWLAGAVIAGALFAVQYEVITKRLAKSSA